MANSFSPEGVWRIDTAGAGMIDTQKLYVKAIRWVAPAAVAGNTVVVQNAASAVLWESVASGANYTEEAIVEEWWESGFKVPTLAAGVLYVTVA